MERISSVRMHAALEEWLPFYDDPKCTSRIRSLLLKMSRSTLERLLKQIRATQKGIGTTQSALSGLKTQIPLSSFDRQPSQPGTMQADTVSHCGSSGAGPFISSLTLTDLLTTWTCNRAIPSKKAHFVRKAFNSIHQELTFEVFAINTDSGSEFLNSPIARFKFEVRH